MIKQKYHTPISSLYVEIVKIKYQNDLYMKCHIKYYYKSNRQFATEEKNVKIYKKNIKHWEVFNE
jgi:hypothetical protein